MRELLIYRYSVRLNGLMHEHGRCRTLGQLQANLRLQARYNDLLKCLSNGVH